MATKDEIQAFFAAEFPQTKCRVLEITSLGSVVKFEIDSTHLRPGETVAGPVIMAVGDVALYAAILGEIGIVPLAVTTSMTINFLRKPAANKNLIGVCTLLKLGKSLAIGEVFVYSEGTNEPVAHVVGTYSIPPKASAG